MCGRSRPSSGTRSEAIFMPPLAPGAALLGSHRPRLSLPAAPARRLKWSVWLSLEAECCSMRTKPPHWGYWLPRAGLSVVCELEVGNGGGRGVRMGGRGNRQASAEWPPHCLNPLQVQDLPSLSISVLTSRATPSRDTAPGAHARGQTRRN